MLTSDRRAASSFSVSQTRAFFCAALTGAMLLGLAGCAGQASQFSFNETDVAKRFLPTERKLAYHPDSMRAVDIVEKENSVRIRLEAPFEELLRGWSATWESQSAGPTARGLPYRSFATLWSLELSLASLQPEVGLQGLSKDLARRYMRERRTEYDSTLQIDVYSYRNSPPQKGNVSEMELAGPGNRITLRDNRGNEYDPIRAEASPIRQGFVRGGEVLYQRNTFFFDRTEEEKDILNNVEELRLWVRGSLGYSYYFTWSFEQVDTPTSP